jgi:exopolyphosphatase / guanosine-5'-triphosphate,3'-diphosphate pyrophosphatase
MFQTKLMQQTRNIPEPATLAAVDLGSNSFHMIVCRIQQDQLVVVDRLREMVRLAAGIDADNNLSPEAQGRALACLTRFGQRLAQLPANCIRVVGTNTLRSARNAKQFIQAAEAVLGHSIEIIAGVEEARLIYLGVAHNTAADKNRRLVIDIGGGSTELIIGEQFTPLKLESLHMGCVSMSERFFGGGQLSSKAVKAAEIAALQEFEPILAHYKKMQWHTTIGASGTIRAIDRIIAATGWSKSGITREALKQLVTRLRECDHVSKLNLPELDSERAPVLPGGILILWAAFKSLDIDLLRVSDGALREGLIHDLLGRIHHDDVRAASVNALAERYHSDREQISRVAATAHYCFAQLVTDWGFDAEEDAQWLHWAVNLHEIGLDISHSGYQKHGAYVIEHTDLAGFSREEQRYLALLVMAQRRKFPDKEFKALAETQTKIAKRLAILLRLATLLHRSRSTDELPKFTLAAKGKSLSLCFPPQWLANHPLTEADLQQEASYLAGADITLQITDN